MPAIMEPIIITKVNREGTARRKLFQMTLPGTMVEGHFFPSSEKWARNQTFRHSIPQMQRPGRTPATNIFATEILPSVPTMTIAALGGMIGPIILEAAVMPAAKPGS